MKKLPSETELERAFSAAWQLVEQCGLKKKAYHAASYQTAQDALWLISQGQPASKVVGIMNKSPRAGCVRLHRLRVALNKERLGSSALAEQAALYALNATHLATVLSRLNPGALIAELKALTTSESGEKWAREAHAIWTDWLRKV